MKIAVDGQVFFEEQKTGIGWLAHNVICCMPSIDKTDEIQLNCFTLGGNRKRQYLVEQYREYGIQNKKCGWFHGGIYSRIWKILPIPYWFFFGRDTDITVFFNYIIPPGVKGKKIAFVHDMAYRAYPATVEKRTRAALEKSLEHTCRIADRIITISQFSKTEIMKYMGVDEKKIDVIRLGVDSRYYHPNYRQVDIQTAKLKYGVPDEYFFYQGTIEPRKNLERLIRAYGLLYQRNRDVPALVLAGKKGWLYDEIFRAVTELQLEKKVLFLGYIDIKDIPKLMCGAVAFVYPSLYEGFGLPPLEAMSCGTPVIASNAASIPEVVGDAGILVDPKNEEEIADALGRICTDSQLGKQLRNAGLQRAKEFSWEESAKQVVASIRSMR